MAVCLACEQALVSGLHLKGFFSTHSIQNIQSLGLMHKKGNWMYEAYKLLFDFPRQLLDPVVL